MRLASFFVRRVAFATPQILAITLVTFLIVRLLPGNPAAVLAGSYATHDSIASIERELGLDKPIWEQYVIYLKNLVHGDLGTSWFSTLSVSQELSLRIPATLELVTIALLIIVLGGVSTGILLALGGGWIRDRLVAFYGYLSGSFPDFYLGLVLSFVFFFLLGWFPSPFGRLDKGVDPPPKVTGAYTIDSLLAGQWHTFESAVTHLALPVLTLVIVYTGPILKLSAAVMDEMLKSDFCRYARAAGLPTRIVVRYALRNSLPPVVTLVGFMYGYLLGGAVLVETIFSWGGLGQYVVDSVKRADYFPVQAVVLVAALFNLIVYFIVDVIHFWIDPRVERA
jgi:peptide/nickel transport system permease protein